MRLKLLALSIAIVMTMISCKTDSEQKSDVNESPNIHEVVVAEVIQAGTYTYLRVTENDIESWLAVTRRQAKEGDILYYNNGMEMKNFTSKELDRTFETVLFIDNITDKQISNPKMELPKSPNSSKEISRKEGIKISTAENGISISEIFSKRDKYAGQRVKVRGEVVKYNSQIMGRNWVHIQDGTSDKSNYDLTITTNDMVKVGDVVTFEGNISLNMDFGAGYSYEVIMEDAKLKTE